MSKFADALKGTLPTEPGKIGQTPAVTPPTTVEPPVTTPAVVTPPAVQTPPAPATTPAAGISDPDADILSGKRSPKSEDFKRVKSAVSDWKSKAEIAQSTAAEREKEVATLKEQLKTAGPSDYEEIKGQLAKYKGYAETALLEVLPEFTAKYKARTETVASNLKTLLGDKAAEILDVLQTPDSQAKRKQLAELMDGMDDFTKGEVVAANRDFRQIDADRRKELSEADARLQAVVKDRTDKQSKQKAELDAVMDTRLKELTDPEKGIDTFKAKDKDEAWNAGVQERIRQARIIYSGNFETPRDRAEAAIRAVSAEVYLHQSIALSKKVAELEGTITKLQAAGPRVSGSGVPAGGKSEKGGFASKVIAGMGKSS